MAEFDDVAKRAQEALGKAQQTVAANQDRINSAIDKAKDTVDARTKNEHTAAIHNLAERAKEAVDRLASPAGGSEASADQAADTPLTPLPEETGADPSAPPEPSPFTDEG